MTPNERLEEARALLNALVNDSENMGWVEWDRTECGYCGSHVNVWNPVVDGKVTVTIEEETHATDCPVARARAWLDETA